MSNYKEKIKKQIISINSNLRKLSNLDDCEFDFNEESKSIEKCIEMYNSINLQPIYINGVIVVKYNVDNDFNTCGWITRKEINKHKDLLHSTFGKDHRIFQVLYNYEYLLKNIPINYASIEYGSDDEAQIVYKFIYKNIPIYFKISYSRGVIIHCKIDDDFNHQDILIEGALLACGYIKKEEL